MKFEGLIAWAPGEDTIEVESTDGLRFDLHNCGWFERLTWSNGDELSLHIRHDPTVGVVTSMSGPATVVQLKFVGVRDLHIRQPEDWQPEEANAVAGWTWHPVGGDLGELEIDVGGLEFHLVASIVRLTFTGAASGRMETRATRDH